MQSSKQKKTNPYFTASDFKPLPNSPTRRPRKTLLVEPLRGANPTQIKVRGSNTTSIHRNHELFPHLQLPETEGGTFNSMLQCLFSCSALDVSRH